MEVPEGRGFRPLHLMLGIFDGMREMLFVELMDKLEQALAFFGTLSRSGYPGIWDSPAYSKVFESR